ncbi:class I SAM-dependent methyltransferase [Haloferax sp. S1W]|uniref:class I SAM-dependent methyltransferase n=1 Tax=Haloferax sp. S1W TaxID=3377110 RepID=UPI0037CC7D1B
MDVPTTVTTALEDRPVEGAVCLEAGAGVGNTTAGLLADGASRVYAVTNDRDDAVAVRKRVDDAIADTEPDRTAVLEADVRSLPLAPNSVDIITAHGLFNLLEPPTLDSVATELTRVAAPGCHLVVDDYDPLPEGAAVRELFALENAASELVDGRPALTFYPGGALRRLFDGYGWTFDRTRTLLDPVPWTESHIEAHASVTRSLLADLPGELGEPLRSAVDDCADRLDPESVGEMYSLALRFEP